MFSKEWCSGQWPIAMEVAIGVTTRQLSTASYADRQSLLLGPAFPAETTLRILWAWHQWICSEQSVFVSQDKDNYGACDG